MHATRFIFSAALVLVWDELPLLAGEPADETGFRLHLDESEGTVRILLGTQAIASYVFRDPEIPRPYFKDLHAADGVRLSRRHPPREPEDFVDHAKMHPGLWLAFGDISSFDSWRLAAPIRQLNISLDRQDSQGGIGFDVANAHCEDPNQSEPLFTDETRFRFENTENGILLSWDVTFTARQRFHFGDQEEMGLGLRVASPLRVQEGAGRMVSSSGGVNEEAIWGEAADWCDYSGEVDGRWAGMALNCHPDNFRPSRMHARDYGFLAANPFGRRSFGGGESSQVRLQPGQTLRLRYGVLLHSHESKEDLDLERAYQDYLLRSEG